jgi:UDP-N-acetylmuramate-alanine ligase
VHIAKREDIAAWMVQHAKPGDLLLTLGAGNIQLSCNEVIALLEQKHGPANRKNLVRL